MLMTQFCAQVLNRAMRLNLVRFIDVRGSSNSLSKNLKDSLLFRSNSYSSSF